jgi:hypothetical protein
MLADILLAQLTAAAPDPVYSSAAVRDLVARAAIANRAPPPELLRRHGTGRSGCDAGDQGEGFQLYESFGRGLTTRHS